MPSCENWTANDDRALDNVLQSLAIQIDQPRFLVPRDVVEKDVNTIGTLRNTVEDEVS